MDTVIKTISVLLVCVFFFLYCIVWVVENFGIFAGTWAFIAITGVVGNLYFALCQPCEVSSNQKKTSINENQTTKKTILVQSKTEPVVQTTTSFDVKPTKQYPVLDEIQNIISNLSKLETNNKNHKAVFIKYNVIKRQFYVDYQKTIDMLAKLNKTKQTEEKYWESFRRYLDLFKEQKDIIYKQLT